MSIGNCINKIIELEKVNETKQEHMLFVRFAAGDGEYEGTVVLNPNDDEGIRQYCCDNLCVLARFELFDGMKLCRDDSALLWERVMTTKDSHPEKIYGLA